MLQAGFILLTLALAIIIIIGAYTIAGRAFTEPKKRTSFTIRTAITIIGWLAYISILSAKGIFMVASAPPRIPLLMVAPVFAFIAFFFLSGKFRNIIAATPPSWLVYLQSFRIVVELLILGSYLQGILPRAATFEGYNFDILMGITALPVAYLTFTRKVLGKTILRLWNIAGFCTLAVVVFVVISHIYFPAVWHLQDGILANGIGMFPFTFLTGFLMPLAVFLHIFSLVKTKQQ